MDADIEKAEEELQETLARLARLRKQRRLLRERSSQLVSRGMRELDEEDGVRPQEESLVAEQHAVGDLQASGAFGVIDWSALCLDELGPVAAGGSSSGGVER